MNKYLLKFLTQFEYSLDAINDLTRDFDKISQNKDALKLFKQAVNLYSKTRFINYNYLISQSNIVAEMSNVHKYSANLLLFIFMAKQLKKYYKKYNFSQEMYYNTLCDLKYKAIECKLIKGVWGTFVAGWFDRFFMLERFAINDLQFELVPFNYNYTTAKLELTPKTQVINVHIPRTGKKLNVSMLDKTFNSAMEFFKERFNLKTFAFTCGSWLLYPENLKFYKEGSNLKKFTDYFTLIDSYDYKDYSEVWRLFDMDYTDDLSKFPADSSLRRFYIQLMKDKKPIGHGVGVYIP